jgi:2-(1,2-epoxy-1,2-dihydrophenyl)acetyl-CoA isomerase
MPQPSLLVDLQDQVMTLTLNRPDKLNAIDNELAQAFLSSLEHAGADSGVHAVLVRGQGRSFCAGRDVSAPPTEQDLVLVQAVSRAMVALDKPILFAVHGWTVGAGLEWMLNADVVVASADSRFKLPEASLGVFVTGGITATLPACAGLARAKALMLLGEEFHAPAAHAWGLVWEVVAAPDLQARARVLAARLAALRPDVVRQFKRVLNDVGLERFEHAVELENAAQRALQAAP